MGDEFHTHELHFVVDEVACTVARVGCEHDLGAGFGFDGVHHLEGLHFQSFGNLQGDETVVIGADPLHQLVQFEVVAVKVHGSPRGEVVASLMKHPFA